MNQQQTEVGHRVAASLTIWAWSSQGLWILRLDGRLETEGKEPPGEHGPPLAKEQAGMELDLSIYLAVLQIKRCHKMLQSLNLRRFLLFSIEIQ